MEVHAVRVQSKQSQEHEQRLEAMREHDQEWLKLSRYLQEDPQDQMDQPEKAWVCKKCLEFPDSLVDKECPEVQDVRREVCKLCQWPRGQEWHWEINTEKLDPVPIEDMPITFERAKVDEQKLLETLEGWKLESLQRCLTTSIEEHHKAFLNKNRGSVHMGIPYHGELQELIDEHSELVMKPTTSSKASSKASTAPTMAHPPPKASAIPPTSTTQDDSLTAQAATLIAKASSAVCSARLSDIKERYNVFSRTAPTSTLAGTEKGKQILEQRIERETVSYTHLTLPTILLV